MRSRKLLLISLFVIILALVVAWPAINSRSQVTAADVTEAGPIYASPIHGGCYIVAASDCRLHVEPFTINVASGKKLVRFKLVAIQIGPGTQTTIYDWRPDQSNPVPSGTTYTPSLVSQDFAATCGKSYEIEPPGPGHRGCQLVQPGPHRPVRLSIFSAITALNCEGSDDLEKNFHPGDDLCGLDPGQGESGPSWAGCFVYLCQSGARRLLPGEAHPLPIHVEPFTINLASGHKLAQFQLVTILGRNGHQTIIYDWRPDQSNPAPALGTTYTPSLVAKDFAATCGESYEVWLQGRATGDSSTFNLGVTNQFTCPVATYAHYLPLVRK